MKPSYNRRQFIKTFAAAGALSAGGLRAQTETSEPTLKSLLEQPSFFEEQYGDPPKTGESYEILDIPKGDIQKAVGDDPVLPEKNAKDLADQMRKITRVFIDQKVSRDHLASQVLEFLKIMDFTKLSTAFCAAGVSYAACRAYCDLAGIQYDKDITPKRTDIIKAKLTTVSHWYFYPSAGVEVIRRHARENKKWADRSVTPLPGWLVVFSWDKDPNGTKKHIGIVDEVLADGKKLRTLEYNTTVDIGGDQRQGGHVAERERTVDGTILGYVRIYEKK